MPIAILTVKAYTPKGMKAAVASGSEIWLRRNYITPVEPDSRERLADPARLTRVYLPPLVPYQPNLVTLRTDLVKRVQERCRIR